ncbi:GGDEF domain-containing protein [Mycobacterium sp.]|uniref:GGDEF domain-containing protein n=1 Tax=Mycobacterium sp. TaxID=1785 RepID=UPI00260AF374|nr:GGDEF domain-containing protein [Mycobacterium sp.]
MLAGAAGALEAARLIAAGHATLAFTGYFLVLELNVVVPLAIHIVVRALGVDLLRADRDPLTGLLNRRACDRAIIGRMLAGRDHMFLAVAMVDLDHFKAVNDSRGHAAGDEALVAAARAITAVCQDSAVIGRIGGEEFLIADVVSTERPQGWGHKLCDAVATIPASVTASVGTATLALRSVGCDDAERALRQLVVDADTAMYEAKRCGGNQARHHGSRTPATTS